MVLRSVGVTTILLTGSLVSGCATIPRHAGFPDVAKTVEQRAGLPLHQYPGAPTGLVSETIQDLLREELTLDSTVRIALLNNRALQATLEELGIARADAVQASLLSNPVFSGHARVPEGTGQTNLELSLAQSVVDTLMLPLRQRVARAQFEQTKLQVSDAILRFLAEVKTAYYTAQAAEQLVTMRQTVLGAAEAAAELAQRQYTAGNIKDIDLANHQAFFQQTQAEVARSEAQAQEAREVLNRLFGLSGPHAAQWRMVATLAELPEADPAPDELEALAVSQRLDVAALHQEITVLRRRLVVARVGLLPSPTVGIDTEEEADGDRVTGPTWDVAVPVFDWGQGARGRLAAQLRQARHRLAALEVAVRSEVRTACGRMAAERKVAQRYKERILPLREQIVASSLRHYNYMLLGAFDLLLAKQQEVEARQAYLESLRDYWMARAELERAVGGTLPSPQEQHDLPHEHHHGGERP